MVKRAEVVDYITYEEMRSPFRADVMKAKELRRIHIGETPKETKEAKRNCGPEAGP